MDDNTILTRILEGQQREAQITRGIVQKMTDSVKSLPERVLNLEHSNRDVTRAIDEERQTNREFRKEWEDRWAEGRSTNGRSAIKDVVKEHKERKSIYTKFRENLAVAFLMMAISGVGIFGGIRWVLHFVDEPDRLRQDIKLLSDEVKALKDSVEGLRSQRRAEVEVKPQTPQKQPQKARRKPPAMPSARERGTLAKDSRFIASGRMPIFTLSDGKVSESRRLARP